MDSNAGFEDGVSIEVKDVEKVMIGCCCCIQIHLTAITSIVYLDLASILHDRRDDPVETVPVTLS